MQSPGFYPQDQRRWKKGEEEARSNNCLQTLGLEMAQRLSDAALAEGASLVPSTHAEWLTVSSNFSSRRSVTSDLQGYLHL